MASFLPPVPRIFFLYIEPCLILFDSVQTILKPESITSLLPPALAGRGTLDPQPTPLEMLLGLKSASIMFMLAMLTLAIMLYAETPRLVHLYVAASALTDFPHWAGFFYVLGFDGLSRWREWDAALWMQLLVPVGTFAIKIGYLSGIFGRDRVVGKSGKKLKG